MHIERAADDMDGVGCRRPRGRRDHEKRACEERPSHDGSGCEFRARVPSRCTVSDIVVDGRSKRVPGEWRHAALLHVNCSEPKMTYIDAVILNLTEWACRRFQVLTGRTNVWLAVQFTNLSIIVYFIWAALYFWKSDLAPRVFVGLFCSGVLYALTQTIFKEP